MWSGSPSHGAGSRKSVAVGHPWFQERRSSRERASASRNDLRVSSGSPGRGDSAIDYYERCELGLGQDFLIEVCSAIRRTVEFPLAWPVIERDVRRCLMNRFPYGILYTVEPEGVLVLVLMHLHRHPDHWKERLQG